MRIPKSPPRLAVVLLFVATSCQTAVGDDSLREWTSADGRTLSASVQSIDEGTETIKLKRSDGFEFSLEWSRLSKADIEWIEAEVERLKNVNPFLPDSPAEPTAPAAEAPVESKTNIELPDRHELQGVPMVTQKGNYCVPASAAMIAGYHGVDTDQDEVAKLSSESSENNQGTYPSDMLRAMEKLGFNGKQSLWESSDAFFESMLPKIRQNLVQTGPIYISFKGGVFGEMGHGCVIIGYNDRKKELSFHNPWGNEFQKTYEAVSEEGRGVVYIDPPEVVPVADEAFIQAIKQKFPKFVGDTDMLRKHLLDEQVAFELILCSRDQSNESERFTRNLARREGRKILELAFERNPAVIIPQNSNEITTSYYFVTRPPEGGSRFEVYEIGSDGWEFLGLQTITTIGRYWATRFVSDTGVTQWDLPMFELHLMK